MTKTLKTIFFENRLMAFILSAGMVLLAGLAVVYRQAPQNFYLELIEALAAVEGLAVIMFLGFKVREVSRHKEVLKGAEERLRLFTEIMEEAILIREGPVLVEVNDVLAHMLGYEVSEMIGKSVHEFMDPLSVEKNLAWVKSGYASERHQIQAKRKDGTTFTLLVHGRDIIYQGRPMRLSCGWDITGLKKMEETLQRSEERFKEFAEVTREGILIHEKGVIVDVNKALADMLGMVPSDFIGRDSLFFLDEKSNEAVKKFRAGLIPAVPYEINAIHSDGSLIPCETDARDILWQGKEMRAVCIWNIRNRKNTEEALRQSEISFRNLIEKSPDAMIIHTSQKIGYVNEAMLNLLGYASADELYDKEPIFFVHPEDIDGVRQRIERLKNPGDYNPPQEKRFIRKDGTIVFVDTVSFIVYFEGVPMWVAVARNLTERKKAEQALLKFERLSVIGEMAAGMAHEIRNPLAAISTAAQMLQRKKPPEDAGQLKTILEQSDRLEKLVRDTLDYAKSNVVSDRQLFTLKPILESALRLSQVQFGPSHKKVKIRKDFPAEEIQIYGDSGRLQQIMVNLILNAFQMMSEGGELKLGLQSDEKRVWIRVEDSGPGIAEQDMKRLFEPFFTTKDNGSGLGLAISQRIAQEHGGQIRIERADPRGAAFILQLPLSGEREK